VGSFVTAPDKRRRVFDPVLATRSRRSTELVRKWQRDGYPVLVTDDSRNMTLTRGVFGQLDVPRSQVDLLTCQFDLSLPAESKRGRPTQPPPHGYRGIPVGYDLYHHVARVSRPKLAQEAALILSSV